MNIKEGLRHFRLFCEERAKTIDPGDEEDWHSLSIGYFAALGFDNDDCWELATTSRYKYEYWC